MTCRRGGKDKAKVKENRREEMKREKKREKPLGTANGRI